VAKAAADGLSRNTNDISSKLSLQMNAPIPNTRALLNRRRRGEAGQDWRWRIDAVVGDTKRRSYRQNREL
jgi:hypothetical protein